MSMDATPVSRGPIANFSYRYENIPFKRYETVAHIDTVNAPTESFKGELASAIERARALSTSEHGTYAVLDAGRGAYDLAPLSAMFAENGGEAGTLSPRLEDTTGLKGPFLLIGASPLSARGVRVTALDAGLRAVVDGSVLVQI
jgi:hypothetical protein